LESGKTSILISVGLKKSLNLMVSDGFISNSNNELNHIYFLNTPAQTPNSLWHHLQQAKIL
jgi:hypothetical protein